MLEIERQDAESNTDGPAAAGQASQEQKSGGQGRGLLRRARRAVTRPAGPPQASDQSAAPPAAAAQPDPAGAPPAAAAPKRSRAARSAPAAPPTAAQPGAAAEPAPDAAAGRPPPKIPAATFQPPVVIFQPPDIGEPRAPASPAHPRQQAAGAAQGTDTGARGAGPDDEAGGKAPARRRSRSRAKPGLPTASRRPARPPVLPTRRRRRRQGRPDRAARAPGPPRQTSGTATASKPEGWPGSRRRGGRGHGKGRTAGEDETQGGPGAPAAGQQAAADQAAGDASGADRGRPPGAATARQATTRQATARAGQRAGVGAGSAAAPAGMPSRRRVTIRRTRSCMSGRRERPPPMPVMSGRSRDPRGWRPSGSAGGTDATPGGGARRSSPSQSSWPAARR